MSSLDEKLRSTASQAVQAAATTESLNPVLQVAERRRRRRTVAAAITGLAVTAVGVGSALVGLRDLRRDAAPGTVAAAPSGVVYVLQEEHGQPKILRIDLASGSAATVATLPSPPAGAPAAFPDLEPSPTGDELYVAHVGEHGAKLDVVDATTGGAIDTERLTDLSPIKFPTDYVTAAANGRVFVYGSRVVRSEVTEDSLVTYDPAIRALLPGRVSLGDCGGSRFVVPLAGSDVGVVCAALGEVRIVSLSSDGGANSTDRLVLPGTERPDDSTHPSRLIVAAASPDGATIYVVAEDGTVWIVNGRTREIVDTRRLPIGANSYVTFNGFTTSGNAGFVLRGDLQTFDTFRSTTIREVALAAWSLVREAPFEANSGAFIVAPSGEALALNGAGDSVVSIDAADAGSLAERPLRGWSIDLEPTGV